MNFARLNFGGPTGAGADFVGNVGVSYFVGKDADESNPQMVLSGDRNLGNKGAAWGPGTTQPSGVTGYSPNATAAPGTGYFMNLASVTNLTTFQWTDKLHQAAGNICLSDGSVQQPSSSKMRDYFKAAGDPNLWTYFP